MSGDLSVCSSFDIGKWKYVSFTASEGQKTYPEFSYNTIVRGGFWIYAELLVNLFFIIVICCFSLVTSMDHFK